MKTIDCQTWKQDLQEFKEKTEAFYAGELDKMAYKGFSGYYGSYAQKGGKASMLRLRMTAGRVTKEKMAFTARVIREHAINRIHFTTCQTIQLHDLAKEIVFDIMEKALDFGIVTMGGGGDFPRNVMCSPLTGVEKGEYFDVLPYAEAASDYLMNFIKAEKMPRKLKVCFSNSPANVPHATYRDLGFAAREDGTFDVYGAGGLGNHPKLGVKVAESVAPEKILYYIKAMWLTFRAYGNYENRGKARTRYMQDTLGGAEKFAKAFQEKLNQVLETGENLDLSVSESSCPKKGNGSAASGRRIMEQKQDGLYTVSWHPLGGQPSASTFCALSDLLQTMDGVEMRLAPDETAYIINLTGDEAKKVMEVTSDGAASLFETSVSCIGASICQVGVRDSQALLASCIEAVRKAELPDGALPQIHISGCPSSCAAHQIGKIGFRGALKVVDKKPVPTFLLYAGGNDEQGEEKMGVELGNIPVDRIPDFLIHLARIVEASGMGYDAWEKANPDGVKEAAADYLI